MQKKIIWIIILAVFLTVSYKIQSAKNVPIEEIESEISSKIDLSLMKKCTDRDLVHFLEIEPASTKGYFYYKGIEALSVDELLVIKTKGHSALPGFRDLVDKRIEDQISTFEGYGPKQVASLKDALIIQKGPYILYYVGNDAQKIAEVFKNAI